MPWDDDAILQESFRQKLVSRDPSNIKEEWKRWMAEYAASGAVHWDDHAVKLNPRTGEVVDQIGKKVSAERKTIGNVVCCQKNPVPSFSLESQVLDRKTIDF